MNTGIIVLLVLYFLPTILAWARSAKGMDGVLIINLFLGWTFVGWVIALAWAAVSEKRVKEQRTR